MTRIGFMGLGNMGLPMAENIVRAGLDLTVFNRSREKAEYMKGRGAKLAESTQALLKETEVVVMMLTGPEAIEATLGRVLNDDPSTLEGKLVVNMGTNPPAFAQDLGRRLEEVGAGFVDAPVLGTKEPARQGTLVVLASGNDDDLDQASPVFSAVGDKVVNCGEVPKATLMKLGVNLVLSASLEGLMEGAHFSQKAGLNLETFFQLILQSPLGNGIFALKAKKLLEQDYSPQASLSTVREMLKHIVDTAYDLGASTPSTLVNLNLTTAAVNRGWGDEDACALIKVFGN